jgi:hypothetical protein
VAAVDTQCPGRDRTPCLIDLRVVWRTTSSPGARVAHWLGQERRQLQITESCYRRVAYRRRIFLRWLTSGSLMLVGITFSQLASAAKLDWHTPQACPTAETVEHRVRIAIGVPLEQAGDSRFKCSVTESTNGSFRLELRVEIPSVETAEPPRIIEANTCDQVADTAVIAIALALGATALEEPSDSVRAAPDVRSRRQDSSVSVTGQNNKHKDTKHNHAAKPPPVAPSESSHLWVGARVGPVVDRGSLPGFGLGLAPAFDFGYRAVSARLSATIFGTKRTALVDGAGGEFSLWTAALAACGNTPRERAHATLCAGLEVGKMTGSGIGSLKVARQGSVPWWMLHIQVDVVTNPWLFGMRSYFGGLAGAPLIRHPFTLGTLEQVYRPESIVLRLVAGLEVDWQ